MRFSVVISLVVGAFVATSVSAAPEPARQLRSMGGTVDALKKAVEEVNENAALRNIAKELAGLKKAVQLSDDQVAALAKLAEKDQLGAKLTTTVAGGLKNQGDDVAKAVSEVAKKDEGVAKLVTEVAKKDDEVAKVIAEGAKNEDEVVKLTKVLSAGEKTDANTVKMAAALSTAAKTDDVTDDMMQKLSKMLAEELKKAEPKKRSLLRKAVYAALGITAGGAVIYTANDLLKSNSAA